MKKLKKKMTYILTPIEKILKNKKARTEFFLRSGLLLNVIFTFYNLFTGFFYRSVWFGSVAIYYLMLCLVKFFLLKRGFDNHREIDRALKDMRICGIMLLILNITIALLIYRMINENSVRLYGSTVIYMAAIYTVFRIAAAVVDFVGAKRQFDPTIYTAKGLSLSVAMMSLFSLQTALLDRTSVAVDLKKGLNLLSGAIISATIIIVAIRTVLRANKELKIRKKKKSHTP